MEQKNHTSAEVKPLPEAMKRHIGTRFASEYGHLPLTEASPTVENVTSLGAKSVTPSHQDQLDLNRLSAATGTHSKDWQIG